jgi:D-alanyl-D-alanine carboxypeptidase
MNAPGEKYAYANTNHTLLGLVIEHVTGNNLVDDIHRRILKPLNLSDIYLEGFQSVPSERLSKRYHYSTPEFERDAGIHSSFPTVREGLIDVSTSNLSVEWAAGGMVASASDLACYAAALQTGKLLQPQSMAFMKDWFPIKPGQEIGHGMFRVCTQAGYTLVGHMGAVLGYTASMQWFEGQDLAMVVLANVGTMHIGQSLPNAATLAYQEKFLELVSGT